MVARLDFKNDEVWELVPKFEFGENMYDAHLVMTKEIFIECYKKWVLEADKPCEKEKICYDCAYREYKISPLEPGVCYCRCENSPHYNDRVNWQFNCKGFKENKNDK